MGKSKKVRKHLSSSQAQFLGFDPKPRYKNGRKSKKDLKKLALYDELDSKGKVMVYDIETSMVRFDAWGTGQQYVRHDQLVPGPEGETAGDFRPRRQGIENQRSHTIRSLSVRGFEAQRVWPRATGGDFICRRCLNEMRNVFSKMFRFKIL